MPQQRLLYVRGSIRSCHQQAAGGRGCGRGIHHDASSCHWRCSRVEGSKKGHLVGPVIVEEGLVANLQEMDWLAVQELNTSEGLGARNIQYPSISIACQKPGSIVTGIHECSQLGDLNALLFRR